MWELAGFVIRSAVGLITLLLFPLIPRWMMGIRTPREDYRMAVRIFVRIQTWCARTWQHIRLWTLDQLGWTRLRLAILRRKVQQGQYQEDLGG